MLLTETQIISVAVDFIRQHTFGIMSCALLEFLNHVLVLGAFGCGAFANNPRVVADATFDALEEFINCFDMVEFAIYCRKYETENYDAFLQTYKRRTI